MAYAFVQLKEASQAAAATNMSTGSFAVATTAGNAIAFIFSYVGGALGATITRSGETGTIIKAAEVTLGGINYTYGCIKNAAAATTAVVATFASSTFLGALAMEYSGLEASGTLFQAGETASQNQATPGTGADGCTSTNITPGVQPDVLIGWCINPNSSTNVPTAGTGFTSRASGWATIGESIRPEDKRLTATSAVAATFTAAANTQHQTIGMVLREGSGLPPAQTIQRKRRTFLPVFIPRY